MLTILTILSLHIFTLLAKDFNSAKGFQALCFEPACFLLLLHQLLLSLVIDFSDGILQCFALVLDVPLVVQHDLRPDLPYHLHHFTDIHYDFLS